MKRCRGCLEEKALKEFGVQVGGREGRRARCKACCRDDARKRYASDPAKYRARTKQWQRENPDRVRDNNAKAYAAWSPEDHEANRLRVKAWQTTNPERVRETSRVATRRREARKRNQFVEDVYPLVVLEVCDGVCGLCGNDVDPQDFHVDHIVPLSWGGQHSYANCQVAHPHCNWSKNARFIG